MAGAAHWASHYLSKNRELWRRRNRANGPRAGRGELIGHIIPLVNSDYPSSARPAGRPLRARADRIELRAQGGYSHDCQHAGLITELVP